MLGLVLASLVATTSGSPSVDVGGQVFFQYSYDLDTSENAYDVTRAFLDVVPRWNDELTARITPDVVRETPPLLSSTAGSLTPSSTAGSLVFRLRHAYVTWTPVARLSLRAGLQPTPVTSFEEEIWNHRALAPPLAEAFFGMSP